MAKSRGRVSVLLDFCFQRKILTFPSLPSSCTGAKSEMVKSKLPNAMLGKVWKLADVDMDGKLDMDEFALAMHLINVKLDGHELPTVLPQHLVPPSKLMNGN